jgi:hypothetical protein
LGSFSVQHFNTRENNFEFSNGLEIKRVAINQIHSIRFSPDFYLLSMLTTL